MRTQTKHIARTVLLVALAAFPACNSYIDEEPNVVLEVSQASIAPVTGTFSPTTGLCVFTIANASITFANKPKNGLSGTSVSPFNDIVLQSIIVDYVWDDGAALSGQQFGVSGTVPAGGTIAAQVPLANATVLGSGAVPRDGHTATLMITAYGVTISGDTVHSQPFTGGTLAVNSCI
jgi:hypothetical protein